MPNGFLSLADAYVLAWTDGLGRLNGHQPARQLVVPPLTPDQPAQDGTGPHRATS